MLLRGRYTRWDWRAGTLTSQGPHVNRAERITVSDVEHSPAAVQLEEVYMAMPQEVDFYQQAEYILDRMRHGGVLCTVVDDAGKTNVLTLGWGLVGPSYHGHPVLAIAVTPRRYSWRFLEEVPDFVIAVPDDTLKEAVAFCGRESGRDVDKFAACGLTVVPSQHVRAPSIAECPLNVECRTYTKIAPPHMLLTPEHRKAPVDLQHTIYFAEVLGTFRYAS